MKKNRWKEPAFALAFLLVACLLVGVASAALRPVRVDYGAVWPPYLAEEADSLDYLYLGSSYTYCDLSPAVVYQTSGLTGYVMAGPEQTLSQTYWYLKEALKTQSPTFVMLEGSALHFQTYQDYTQVNVGYMPDGLAKLGAIFTASEPELRTGLLFDLYFYHNRWKDITVSEAASALVPAQTDALKGFTAVDGVFAQNVDGPFTRPPQPEELYQANLQHLSDIVDLCNEAETRLILVLHPTYSQLPEENRLQIAADAADLGIEFHDWSQSSAEMGIEPLLHYYDPGHLNREGAEIFSRWVGQWFAERGETPRVQQAENDAAWQALADE